MSESIDENFCVYLEYHLGLVFQKSDDERVKHFWCDGVAIPSSDQLERKFVNDKRKLVTKAWIGKDGQSEYEISIKLGKYALRRFAKGKSLKDCIPGQENSDWIEIDVEMKKIELSLL